MPWMQGAKMPGQRLTVNLACCCTCRCCSHCTQHLRHNVCAARHGVGWPLRAGDNTSGSRSKRPRAARIARMRLDQAKPGRSSWGLCTWKAAHASGCRSVTRFKLQLTTNLLGHTPLPLLLLLLLLPLAAAGRNAAGWLQRCLAMAPGQPSPTSCLPAVPVVHIKRSNTLTQLAGWSRNARLQPSIVHQQA
jgi:hypothetical protein